MTVRKLFDAYYELLSVIPETNSIGDVLLLEIAVTNTGKAPLAPVHSHPIRLSYHLRDTNSRVEVHDGLRTQLPGVLYPDETIRIELRVDPPALAGDYLLEIELVEERVGWFNERGVPPLVQTVHYTPLRGPRVTIINGNCILNDAVGNQVTAQLRALHAAGYQPLLLAEHVDERLPIEVRRFMIPLRLRDIRQPHPQAQYAVDHFRASALVIVNYSTYYELVEAIRSIRNSVVIFDYHGVTPPELWEGDPAGRHDLLLGQQNLHLVKYADYAVAHSTYTYDELLRTGLMTPDRTHLLPYAILEDLLPPGERNQPLIEQYGLRGRRVLLYVGRMARNKRIIDLVEALAIIRQQYPETVLVLVGDNRFGPFYDYVVEVQQRTQELGCADAVIWTGQVPNLADFYDLCDIFVTASIHEGFGIPAIEAMAHGKPVVVAAAAALPGTIGEAGLLFEPGNPADLAAQVMRLLADPPLAADGDERLRTGTIGFVSPRYGPEILGGAERMIRGWAEQLARRGYRTEALTTCTARMDDWTNHYTPGVYDVNGITVRRFPTDRVRSEDFHRVLDRANRDLPISRQDEQEFMRNNLQSTALNQYVHEHAGEYVAVVFGPYLFGTSYWGMQALPDKAIILPCLHDEPAARFSIFREMLEAAAGIFFNAYPECELARDKLHVANPHYVVTGYGFETDRPAGDAEAFRARHHLSGPILLYSGRLEAPKNVPLLLDYFVRYKQQHPGPLTLALAGTGDIAIPQRPDIVELGFLSDELPDAYAAASMLCQPSVNESFSIVIMESWLQSRPVLVHADCAVTNDHVVRSGGGYAFRDYETFRTALDRVFGEPAHATELGQRGRVYVEQNYAWDVVIDRFLDGIRRFTAPPSLRNQVVHRGTLRALEFTRTRFDDALTSLVERILEENGSQIDFALGERLRRLAQVGLPDYTIRSGVPLVGRLIGWTRAQMTAHLKEPYLDQIIAKQEAFNNMLLQELLPMLEQSLHEQQRLRRDVERLRYKPESSD